MYDVISFGFGHWARCDRWYFPKKNKKNRNLVFSEFFEVTLPLKTGYRNRKWLWKHGYRNRIWPSNMVTGTENGLQIWLPEQKMAFKYGYRNKFIFGKLTPCSCTWRLPWWWWTSWTSYPHVLHVLLPIIIMVVLKSTPPSLPRVSLIRMLYSQSSCHGSMFKTRFVNLLLCLSYYSS